MTSGPSIPSGVVEVRAEICGRCPTPCEHQRAPAFHAAPCAACPVNHWGQYGRCQQFTSARAPGIGLGDAVAAVAQPIARLIDRLAGTDLEHCGGCKKRREALNRLTQKPGPPSASP